VIGEDNIEVQRVAVAQVDSGGPNATEVTPRNLHVFEFDWRPDSRGLAYIAAEPPGENNWWVAQLYTRDIDRPTDATGRACPTNGECYKLKSILNPQTVAGPLHGLQIAVPRWSPDGKTIAVIGGLMSDQGSTGGDIYLVPVDGGEPQQLQFATQSAAWFRWLDDRSLMVSAVRGGGSSVLRVSFKKNSVGSYDVAMQQYFGGGENGGGYTIDAGPVYRSLSTSPDGTHAAFVQSSFSDAPEVWAGCVSMVPIGGCPPPRAITHLNDRLKPVWGKTENVEWTDEGFKVQGWLLYPADYDPSKTYPLIVEVHGGPGATTTPRWPGLQYGGVPFSALGYFVFFPNPRGSFGQGEKFTQANVKDFGYGDMRDILAGMDVLEKRFPIDKEREGLTGWSYGGFMTMFAVTQTTRFKAAVAGAGISDWKSYYGENSIDQWMIPFFGASVYDDPAVYAKSSAINYIKDAKTPTLIVVGDRDGECPAPQSFEFWHALRAVGVKTELVVYPNEGHQFRDPAHQRDVLARALELFETEMPEK
ncbi:MAG: prolyl oligopeptidase family serine peptidase, partial [Candidatus Acidiferrales bacterium]